MINIVSGEVDAFRGSLLSFSNSSFKLNDDFLSNLFFHCSSYECNFFAFSANAFVMFRESFSPFCRPKFIHARTIVTFRALSIFVFRVAKNVNRVCRIVFASVTA